MKQAMFALIVCLAVCGCATKRTYSTLIQIAPAKEPGKVHVAAVVNERSSSWIRFRQRQFPCPILTCQPGQTVREAITTDDVEIALEARIAVAGEKKQTDCLLTVKRGREVVAASRVLLPALAFNRSATVFLNRTNETALAFNYNDLERMCRALGYRLPSHRADPEPLPSLIKTSVQAVGPGADVIMLGVGSEHEPTLKEGCRFLVHRGRAWIGAFRVILVKKKHCLALRAEPLADESSVKVGDPAFSEGS